MACFSRLKCHRLCHNKVLLCHKYHSGKHGAIPQEIKPCQNPITLSFQTSVSHRMHLHETGGTSQTVVHRLKEHTAFFPSCSGVSWTRKEGNSFGAPFVVCCSTFSKCVRPSQLFHLKHLRSCHLLARHRRRSCPRVGVYKCNQHRCAQQNTFIAAPVHMCWHSLIQASHKWILILVELLCKEIYVIIVWDWLYCQSLSGWGALGIVAAL